MSIDIDDSDYLVNDEGICTASEQMSCCACRESIQVGHRYRHGETGDPDDDGYELLPLCLRCSLILDHLMSLMPPGECPVWTLDCGHTYQERWKASPPTAIAALAFVTPEEMQREPS